MKSIVFLLSIYFLFLAVIPCYCDDELVSVSKVETTVSASHSNPAGECSENGTCSPFCYCSKHHSPYFGLNFEIYFKAISSPVQNTPFYNDHLSQLNVNSLWRPPQV